MFTALQSLCADNAVVISESLDVGRLYEENCKRKAIDDLDWWHLLERLEGIIESDQKLVILDRDYKSLTCPGCTYASRENRLGNRFQCKRCGMEMNPDLVALFNLWGQWLETIKK
jgi:transposase